MQPPHSLELIEPLESRCLLAVGNATVQLAGPAEFYALGHDAYFAGSSDSTGTELWKTDGTPEGTSLVKDIWPGRQSGDPYWFGSTKDYLFFKAEDRQGEGLWSTRGTPDTTVKVYAGPAAWYGTPLMGDRVFFLSAANQRELWTTDGTVRGTRRVSARLPLGLDKFVLGERLAFFEFVDGDQHWVWMSDGTGKGTRQIASFRSDRLTNEAVAVGDTLFLQVRGGKQPGLWRFDAKGAARIGRGGFGLTSLNGRLYYFVDGAHGTDLWASNGRRTALIAPLHSGRVPSFLFNEDQTGVVVGHGKLYAFVSRGPRIQLWSSDGTSRGTAKIATFSLPRGSAKADRLAPAAREVINSGIVFNIAVFDSSPDPVKHDFAYSSDGTSAGTRRIVDGDLDMSQPVNADGRLFFANAATGDQLWIWEYSAQTPPQRVL
ncbi:MAG: hypothetical protein ACM359_16850 [Bacillota bacterium]